ncbi:MAG TPA: ribonuclease P protein component [Micromonosporaceae bacterium]|nr:ribonuclease P protein component [Micromonosporaceae bacterium]
MLPAAQRLRRSGDFGAAVRSGRRAARGAVAVHLLPADPHHEAMITNPARPGAEARTPPARAGFVVSRAVGGAVVRNAVRRRLRHLVRDRLGDLPPGSLLVVRALPGAADRSYARLGADLDAALAAAREPRQRSRRRT